MAKPWFWLGIAPDDTSAVAIDLDNQEIKDLFWQPPSARQFGWNMNFPAKSIVRGGNFIGRGNYKDCEVQLFANGLMEFKVTIDTRFCWQQNENEFQSRPRLHPIPVCEFPLSFLYLYRALSNALDIKGPYKAGLAYINVKGFRLPPGRPDSPLFDMSLPGQESVPYREKKIGPNFWTLDSDFSPERKAFDMAKFTYGSFGWGQESIPYFDRKTQTFDFMQ